ncbi:MAG: sigma-70 family RNA polymerase sigma factor [Myxococcales bacterium]|nr:sigma-70 family RNA polymerase sigma factor [Myxococcales bacterium]
MLRLRDPDSGGVTPEQITSALEGDRDALRRLVEGLVPVIRVEAGVALARRARAHRRDPRQEVDDFTQEVLVRLLADDGKLLRIWDPARGRSLASFVRLITRQRVSRALQRFKGNPWGVDPTEPGDFEFIGEAARGRAGARVESRIELRALLERLRAHLNERGLLLFQLIYVEQRPISEVCDELGMTRGAVDAWNSRTRRLARRLAQEQAA